MKVPGAAALRFEEDGSQLRIAKPSAARIEERLGLSLAGSALALLGAFALVGAWQQVLEWRPGLSWGVWLLLASVWMFWRAARLGDVVQILNLNRKKRTLERDGRVVARFDDVRVVRCNIEAGRSSYEISAVVHQRRAMRDVSLFYLFGRPDEHTFNCQTFEQAAARIAAVTGARLEVKRRAAST